MLGLWLEHRLDPKHFMTVVPGVMHRSATLSPRQLSEVVDRYAIRTVVNLRSAEENARGRWHAEQAALLDEEGVRFVDLPMRAGRPPDPATLARWLAILDDDANRPVLVHCEHGVVRTGMMVSVFELEVLRRDNAEVWAEFDVFGGGQREPVRSRVRDFVLAYVPRWRAALEGDTAQR